MKTIVNVTEESPDAKASLAYRTTSKFREAEFKHDTLSIG